MPQIASDCLRLPQIVNLCFLKEIYINNLRLCVATCDYVWPLSPSFLLFECHNSTMDQDKIIDAIVNKEIYFHFAKSGGK